VRQWEHVPPDFARASLALHEAGISAVLYVGSRPVLTPVTPGPPQIA
jgi:hypothetical protein